MTSGRAMGSNRNGRFVEAGNRILTKLRLLKEYKGAVGKAVLELSDHSNKLISTLTSLDKNICDMESRRKFLQTSGVAATTFGSSLAAVLWALAYANDWQDGYYASLAWVATIVGIGGTVVKMGTAYFCSKSNHGYMKQLEESVSSKAGKHLNDTETALNTKFHEMIQLLKELYGGGETHSVKSNPSDHPLLEHRGTKLDGSVEADTTDDDDEETPLVISYMETADTASCAPDVISTALDYSSNLGFESMDFLDQTYDAATASLGEVISYGLLEGAVSGLAVVLSSYEIYRLIGSWNKENPTSQKIEELIGNVQKRLKVYNNLKRCIEIVDTFQRLKSTLKKQ